MEGVVWGGGDPGPVQRGRAGASQGPSAPLRCSSACWAVFQGFPAALSGPETLLLLRLKLAPSSVPEGGILGLKQRASLPCCPWSQGQVGKGSLIDYYSQRNVIFFLDNKTGFMKGRNLL